MNILIKLMSIVSLVLAPTLAGIYTKKNNDADAAKQNIERSGIKKQQAEAIKTAFYQ